MKKAIRNRFRARVGSDKIWSLVLDNLILGAHMHRRLALELIVEYISLELRALPDIISVLIAFKAIRLDEITKGVGRDS